MQPRLMNVEDPLEELLDAPLSLHAIQCHLMIEICHMSIETSPSWLINLYIAMPESGTYRMSSEAGHVALAVGDEI